MKELVKIAVVEVFVYDAVNMHKVLDDSVSHRQRRLDFVVAVVAICHLKREVALSIYAVSCSLIVLIQD